MMYLPDIQEKITNDQNQDLLTGRSVHKKVKVTLDHNAHYDGVDATAIELEKIYKLYKVTTWIGEGESGETKPYIEFTFNKQV